MYMFSPDQVQTWEETAALEPGARRIYLDRYLGSASLSFSAVDRSERPSVDAGRLRTPARIFGTPEDASCLEGIEDGPVHILPPRIFTVDRARIVGNSALLSGEGALYLPDDASRLTRAEFVAANAHGHQGFLIDDGPENLSISFAQRERPRDYPLDAVFLHSLEPGNFGSFMFRQLPQMLALREADLPFDCYISSERTSFVLEAIELLDLPRRPVFSGPEVSGDRFRSITVFRIDDAEGFVGPGTRSQLKRLVAEVVSEHPVTDPDPAVYVSRALSTLRFPGYRVMTNELEIEALVRSRGLRVLYPETLSLRDQIRHFYGAGRLMGPSGSGMFNLLFSRAVKRVVDIETYHGTVRQHAKLYSACGAEYAFFFSPFCPGDDQAPMYRSSICPPHLAAEALDWLLS